MAKILRSLFSVAVMTAFASLAPTLTAAADDVVLDDTATAKSLITQADTRYIVKADIDLDGKTLKLPSGATLDFQGGSFIHGTLEGDATAITGDTKAIFDRVKFEGSFKVDTISTDMYVDPTYYNAIYQLFRLTNNDMKNTVIINPLPSGDPYMIYLDHGPNGFDVNSNTNILLKGDIQLGANDLEGYAIANVHWADNVDITGGGSIIGDRATHTGTTGEWGMGITIQGCKNVYIHGITVKDCWGDCIYICKGLTCNYDIKIDSCTLSGSRRQGVSVTNGINVYMNDLEITDIKGTDPQAAIDVEPNQGDTCMNIRMNRLRVINCMNGITGGYPFDDGKAVTQGVYSTDCYVEVPQWALLATRIDSFVCKRVVAKSDYTQMCRFDQSFVILDSCYIGPLRDGQTDNTTALYSLANPKYQVTNSEIHAQKLLGNSVYGAQKGCILNNNKLYCQVDLVMTSGKVQNNIIETTELPMLTVKEGTKNTIRGNNLYYPKDSTITTNVALVIPSGNLASRNTLHTGITRVNQPKTIAGNEPQPVYSIDGVLVQKEADLSSLPKGLYIVGRKKMLVK